MPFSFDAQHIRRTPLKFADIPNHLISINGSGKREVTGYYF